MKAALAMNIMQHAHLNQVRILFYEPLSELGGPMTSMLRAEGFTATTHVYALKALGAAIRNGKGDVLLLETDQHEDEILHLVVAVRELRLGSDPFLPIVLAGSQITMQNAHRYSLAGADAVLDKPFSALSVLEHLQDLAGRPRYFVVSPNYCGPEHRHRTEEVLGEKFIQVPNRLHNLMHGIPNDAEAHDEAVSDWQSLLQIAAT